MLKAVHRAWRALFDDNKPPPPAVPAVVPPPRGFFATDPMDLRGRAQGWEEFLKVINPFVFQRTGKDVARVSVGVGMDGALDAKEMTFAQDDALDKSLYGVMGGSPMPGVVLSWYAAQSFIGYQACAILAQHWFIDKACSMPARDAIRNGYDVVRADGEKLTPLIQREFERLDKQFSLKNNCVEAVRNMRIFGVRIILFEVESTDPDYYTKPFNPDGVRPGSYKGISQVDPYWVTPELDYRAASDPASRHFYEPTYWRINGKRYHRSHLVVLTRNEVSDVLKPTYFYGGVPLPQQLYERAYNAERTANEGPQLALTKRLTVIEGVDMAAAAADPTKLLENIRNLAYYRDNYGVHLLGGTESLTQTDTALTDVDVVIMTQFQLCCAIAEVPATKMLGTMPKGFNATGEYEEASYHEMLESVQEHDMEPIITRHHMLCVRSEIAPKFGIPAFGVAVNFAELDAETAKEHAERTALEAHRDLEWAQAGAVDGFDIRKRLQSDKDSGYSGIEDAAPDGPRPRSVVLPDAPATAPNTAPGSTPTPAPATTGGQDAALMSAVRSVFDALK